jgi:hypothetical protein
LPFVEAGEFANCGVVLTCPDLGYFGFRLAKQGWGRISKFFDGVEKRVYRDALLHYQDELTRISEITGRNKGSNLFINNVFSELYRHREGLLQCSPLRTLLAEAPETALSELFEYYIHRKISTREYHEVALVRQIRGLLNSAPLKYQYREETIGDEIFHQTLPFVYRSDDRVMRVIKPLHLAHDDPSDITDHGAIWLERLRRLRRRNFLHGDVLLPVTSPDEQDQRGEAFREIRDELAKDFQVADISDISGIIDFAKFSVPQVSA